MNLFSFLGALGEVFFHGAFILACCCLSLFQCGFTSGSATNRGFGLFQFRLLPPDLAGAGYGSGNMINEKPTDESQKV